MRVAAAALALRPYRDFADFAADFRGQARFAADSGARLVVFPEYVAGGLLALDRRFAAWSEPLIALTVATARECGLFVLGGTHPVRVGRRTVNRAHLAAPDGRLTHQDKLHLTPWERRWRFSAGDALTLVDLGGLRAAILICYDIEFPDACRAAAARGADVLLVPSWTDDRHGYWRVRYCAHARTVEHQVFALHAPLVGGNPALPDFEQAVGRAGVLSPCDTPFARDGILAETEWNQPALALADLDRSQLVAVRTAGSVTPRRDARAAGAYRVGSVLDLTPARGRRKA
jgi:predicted amidohydrolase